MFYHVKITPRGRRNPRDNALAVNKDADWIEEHIAAPRRRGQDIFIDGRVLSWPDVEQIHITQTNQAIVLKRGQSPSGLVVPSTIPDKEQWVMETGGRAVTEQFITGLPGGAAREGTGKTAIYAANRKAVMVIYGHDKEANDALFDWLRAIGLQPREWSQLVSASGGASPYIGQVLEQALEQVQAVVAFFTPDERVIAATAPAGEQNAWRLQARPNVLIEAGMALITHPQRTVLAVLGTQELPSDLAGRHYVRLSHTDPAPLHDLATRLHQAGCDTDLSGTDWLRPSRFPDRDHALTAHHEDNGRAPGRNRTQAQARQKNTVSPGPSPATSPPGRLTRTFIGHTRPVRGVAFSPDGALFATASNDKTVKLWDTATGSQVRILTGHTDVVNAVAFSSNGALIATASDDETARLWLSADGGQWPTRIDHHNAVFGVAFSPAGNLLATASGEETARIWNVATGECVHALTGHTGALFAVAFSRDGALLATASSDQTARIWDLATDGCVRTLTGHTGEVNGVAFGADGTLLATAGSDQTARIWDLATGSCVRTLTGHTGEVNGVAFSPDGGFLAAASSDETARIWDLATGECVHALIGHTGEVNGVAFSPDGGLLATASSDKTARTWAM